MHSIIPKLLVGFAGMPLNCFIECKEYPFELNGILRNFFPEIFAIFFIAVGHQLVTQLVMVGRIISVGSAAQFHPRIFFIVESKGFHAVVKRRHSSSSLITYQGFLPYSISFKKIIRNGNAIGKQLTFLTKKK